MHAERKRSRGRRKGWGEGRRRDGRESGLLVQDLQLSSSGRKLNIDQSGQCEATKRKEMQQSGQVEKKHTHQLRGRWEVQLRIYLWQQLLLYSFITMCLYVDP